MKVGGNFGGYWSTHSFEFTLKYLKNRLNFSCTETLMGLTVGKPPDFEFSNIHRIFLLTAVIG